MKKVSILGSTGSIGTQAVDVVRHNRDNFKIVGLSTNKNIDILYDQILEFEPEAVAVGNGKSASELKSMLGSRPIEIMIGMDGLIELAGIESADIVLISVVGIAGLTPTLKAMKCNKEIALANKETLVSGGYILKKAQRESTSKIIPVDSEHCAIFQCLQCSDNRYDVEKLILTASGGPFRGKRKTELADITPEMALQHPNWRMGKKVTVDSATLMNKGLEVIEAHWLFDVDFEKIDVIIHPQSIIHSMVEYIDGSVIAQLGVHDMRTPIQYALGYPKRMQGYTEKLCFNTLKDMTFEEPDTEAFKCLKIAYDAGIEGGTIPAVLNAANEVAVELFLKNQIKFLDISNIIEESINKHNNILNPGLEDILEVDKETRAKIYKKLRMV